MEYRSLSTTPLEDDLYQSDIVTGAHGDKYQKDLALAIFERATRKGYDFKLGYEMAIADKFDDVAFFHTMDKKWTLIQTKHADTSKGKVPPVKFEMLFPSDQVTREKGDFSLFKYFKSYIKVHNKIEGRSNVVIFTNRDLQLESVDQSVELESRQVDEIFCFTCRTKPFGLKVTKTLVTEVINYVNQDFISLRDSIVKLFMKGIVDPVITSFKTPVAGFLTKTDNYVKFSENPPPDAYQMLDSLNEIIDIKTAHLPLHKAKDLFNGKSRNKTWPLCANFGMVHHFFQDLVLFTGQLDDLSEIINQDLCLWVRTWMRPDYFLRLEESQLITASVGLEQFFNEKKTPVKQANDEKLYKKFLKLTDGREFFDRIKKDLANQIHNLSNYITNKTRNIYINRLIKFTELYDNDGYVTMTIPDENFVDELFKKFRNQRILFLTAEPGMGKSTILEYIALAAQQKSSLYVYLFRLNIFEEKLSQVNKTDKFDNFLSILRTMLSEANFSKLQNSLKGNNNERINFMIFDALDELSPPNRMKVMDVFKQMLTNPSTKILVSARNTVKTLVEKEFKINTMSLVPFNHQNQTDFLRKFWKVSEENIASFRRYVDHLFIVYHSKINGALYEFAGLPLMLKMMAEVYSNHFSEYLTSEQNDWLMSRNTLSIINLYEQFVKKCFANKMKKKFYFFLESDEENVPFLKQFTLEHQLLAIKHLQIKTLQTVFQDETHAETLSRFEMRLKNGTEKSTLVEAVDDNITFIHRSYAEFLVANFLYEYIEKCDPEVFEQDSKKSLFFEHPTIKIWFFAITEERHDDKHLEILGRYCNKNYRIALWAYEVYEMFGLKTIEFLLRTTNGLNIIKELLGVAVVDNNFNLCTYLFKNHEVRVDWKVNEKTLLQIATEKGYVKIVELLIEQSADVNAKDADGNMPLHLAAENDHLNIIKILIANTNDIEGKNKNGWTSLYISACLGNLKTVKSLIEKSAEFDGETPLHVAALNDHSDVVKIFIEKSANIEAKTRNGWTPLHLASHFGNLKTVDILIEKSADIEAKNINGWTSLHISAYAGKMQAINILTKNSADIEAKSIDGDTPLHLAARQGHIQVVQFLIHNFADLEAKENNGWTPLHLSALFNKFKVVEILIASFADIEAKTIYGATPLHFAAEKGHSKVVRLLIAKSADLESKTCYEKTPLHLAAGNGHAKIVELLIANSADIEAKTKHKMTPLHLAAENNRGKIVELLITNSVNIEAKNCLGKTPLHLAAENGHAETVELLITNSAAIESKEINGKTPLHLAAANSHAEIVKLLITNSADIEAKENSGKTPIHLAAANNHADIVKLLIEKSAYIEAKDHKGNTPLHLAVENDHAEIVKLLIANSADIQANTNSDKTPLHLAAANNLGETVKLLITNHADINAKTKYGDTPLHLAAENNRVEIVELLIANSADIDAKEKRGETPLHIAAAKGHAEIVKLLLTYAADIEAKTNSDKTLLHLAAANSHAEIVKLLITNSADIEAKENSGKTPIHLAAANNHADIVKLLIEKSAYIEAKDHKGDTPLHLAVENDHAEIVKLLIANSADIQANTNSDKTPLHLAAANNLGEIVKLLITNHADINAKTKYGDTPLHLAAENNRVEIVELLIANSADIDAKEKRGETPLHIAAAKGHAEIVKLLITNSADIEAKENSGKTPIHLAAANNHADIVKLLIEKSAYIEAKDHKGNTPLHLAVENDHAEIVKLLIANSADIDAKEKRGETPLHIAAAKGHAEIVKLLRTYAADNEATPLQLALRKGIWRLSRS